MPNITDCPEEMLTMKTREELEKATENYKSSILFYIYLTKKVKEFLLFREMSGKDLTFGEYCAECVKIIKKQNLYEI